MWQQYNLKLSDQARIVMNNSIRGINTPIGLSAQGFKLGVHNWSHGIKEKTNHYLSPDNAVKALCAKLTDFADPSRPKGEQQVIVIMVTSRDIDTFIDKLAKVRLLLAEPVFKQALDYAKSSKTLQDSKMIKTAMITSPSFGAITDITPSANRIMQSILRNVSSHLAASQPFDIAAAMLKLEQQKRDRALQNQNKINEMLQTKVNVEAFIQSGDLTQIAEKMKHNIPYMSNVFTAAVMFVGNDLSAIEAMLDGFI